MNKYKRFLATIIVILSYLYRSASLMIIANHIGNIDDMVTLMAHICMIAFESANFILIVKVYLDVIEDG